MVKKQVSDTEIKIVLLGGGTGGHIYPLIAIQEALMSIALEQNMNIQTFYCGNAKNYINELRTIHIQTRFVVSSKWRSYASFRNSIDIILFGVGFFQALIHLILIRPHVIFSKGGPGTFPIILASRVLQTPLIIHESDSIPGTSNRLASHFASKIFLAFQEAVIYFPKTKTNIVGIPHRKELIADTRLQQTTHNNAKKPTLLVVGGSQGARALNMFIQNNFTTLTTRFSIIHQAGECERSSFPQTPDYTPFTHLSASDMAHALNKADIILSRAGAGTLFEIALYQKPAILVPLPLAAHNHQMENARIYAQYERAEIIEEHDLSIDVFTKKVDNIMKRPPKPPSPFSHADAARTIANDIITYATQSSART